MLIVMLVVPGVPVGAALLGMPGCRECPRQLWWIILLVVPGVQVALLLVMPGWPGAELQDSLSMAVVHCLLV